jgi:phosphatidylglycerophosphate synthase
MDPKPEREPLRIGIGDALSLLRALMTVPVIALSATSHWTAAFVCLGLGWATDLVDGACAKQWGGLRNSRPDFDIDGICDSVLAFGSTAVPLIYAYANYGTTAVINLTGLYAMTVVFGLSMVKVMNTPPTAGRRALIAFNMIVSHSIVQIGGGIMWFAYMAAGQFAVWLVAAILAMTAVFQKRKIGLWWAGRFA